MGEAGRELPSEDVYSYDPEETTIVPDAEDEKFESENIDNQANDLAAAFQRFKGQHNTDFGANFDDYLKRRRLRAYGNNAYNLEILGLACSDEIESSTQKYTRLMHELNDLKEQISSEKSSQSNDSKNEALSRVHPEEVDALIAQVKSIQIEQIQGKPSNLNLTNPNQALLSSLTSGVKSLKDKKPRNEAAGDDKSSIQYEIISPLSGVDSTDAMRCAKLEARLSGLEKLIGAQDKLKSTEGGNLLESVQLLNDKVQLLDSAYLDALDERLVSLSTKLTDVIAKAEKAQNAEQNVDEEFSKRIEVLYTALNKYDDISAALPAICDRLLSLQALHEQSMHVSQAITQIDGVSQQLNRQIAQNQEQLTAVKDSMAHNMESLTAALKGFEDRIAKLK